MSHIFTFWLLMILIASTSGFFACDFDSGSCRDVRCSKSCEWLGYTGGVCLTGGKNCRCECYRRS